MFWVVLNLIIHIAVFLGVLVVGLMGHETLMWYLGLFGIVHGVFFFFFSKS